MKKLFFITFLATSVITFLATSVNAQKLELDNGQYVDQYGEIFDNKYENENPFAPWNSPLQKDDPFAPWNNPLQESNPFAPWNNPISDPDSTNQFLQESGETDSSYYWKY